MAASMVATAFNESIRYTYAHLFCIDKWNENGCINLHVSWVYFAESQNHFFKKNDDKSAPVGSKNAREFKLK